MAEPWEDGWRPRGASAWLRRPDRSMEGCQDTTPCPRSASPCQTQALAFPTDPVVLLGSSPIPVLLLAQRLAFPTDPIPPPASAETNPVPPQRVPKAIVASPPPGMLLLCREKEDEHFQGSVEPILG